MENFECTFKIFKIKLKIVSYKAVFFLYWLILSHQFNIRFVLTHPYVFTYLYMYAHPNYPIKFFQLITGHFNHNRCIAHPCSSVMKEMVCCYPI